MSEIKDTGKKRVFDSGAHRDDDSEKGAMHLVPWIQAARVAEDPVVKEIGQFIEDFNPEHIEKALRLSVDTIPEFRGKTIWELFLEVSYQYKGGAEKYGANNWKNGMPLWCFVDSGTRHYSKHMAGYKDEPHHRGWAWNMLGLLWTIDNIPNSLRDFEQMMTAYKVK
jgi:hypothetical protein